jgi:signal transduction histidine kinase
VAHWQIRGIETQVRYERAQAAMLQNQKMVALGRLVDGVAHEILDPLGFIWGNLTHIARYCQQLLQLADTYEKAWPPVPEPKALVELKEEIELSYLQADLPDALSSIQGGAERLKQLATSLQNFCHIDEVYPKPADLHDLLDSIVLLLKSRLTSKIEVIREYTSLPPVNCFGGQLSQVFMNIVTHCVDTLLAQGARAADDLPLADWPEAAITPTASPQIIIRTELLSAEATEPSLGDRWVAITIADNGPGLSPEDQQRILNSFSVQQRLARETDLATSYRIVTAKHGGKFWVRSPRSHAATTSPPTRGTEFVIHLPLYPTSSST